MKSKLLLSLLSVCLLGGVVHAADDPQTGTWKINLTKSRYVTAKLPQSSVATITPFGKDGVSLSVNAVNADGEKITIQYSAQYDGKPYPRVETGPGAIAGQTVALRHIDARTAERIVYLAGKPVGTEIWALSADGKTRTVTQSGIDAHGKPIDNVQIYERQ